MILYHHIELTDADIDVLNRVIATVIKQVEDKAYLNLEPVVPIFDTHELCRIRMKIAPHIGITETIEKL